MLAQTVSEREVVGKIPKLKKKQDNHQRHQQCGTKQAKVKEKKEGSTGSSLSPYRKKKKRKRTATAKKKKSQAEHIYQGLQPRTQKKLRPAEEENEKPEASVPLYLKGLRLYSNPGQKKGLSRTTLN